MGIYTNEELEMLKGKYLSSKDFSQGGMTLKIMAVGVVSESDPKYGAQKDGRGLLQGQTWMYTFQNELGNEIYFKSVSVRLAGAMARLNPEPETMVSVKREGTGIDTKWYVSLAD